MGITINSTIQVAKKELINLLNNRLVLIIMALYLIEFISFLINTTYPFDGMPSLMSNAKDPAHTVFVMLTYSLCTYGSLVAVVLGFASISEELEGKALNTLLVKPLYRDTIINGKILGALGFVLCLFLFTTALYVVFMLMYFGIVVNAFSKLVEVYIPSFVNGLPLVLVLSLLCFFLFYALSILYALLFKSQSFSLFMGILSWIFLFPVLSSVGFTAPIAFFFHDLSLGNLIGDLSPLTIVGLILGNFDFGSALAHNWPEFFKLSLYCFVTLVGAYIVFIRRDVA